jgi:hypothetical protein
LPQQVVQSDVLRTIGLSARRPKEFVPSFDCAMRLLSSPLLRLKL